MFAGTWIKSGVSDVAKELIDFVGSCSCGDCGRPCVL
jgi:hypothetical protein